MTTLTQMITQAREETKDDDAVNGYRFSRLDFEDWYRDAIREIYGKRKDVELNDDYELNSFTDPYRYDASAYYIDDFIDLSGWDKVTYPVLYFNTTGANAISAYAEVGHSTELFSLSWSSLGDLARITNVLGEFGGFLTPIQDIAHTPTAFTITAVEIKTDIDAFLERAIVFYLSFRLFAIDNADTFNSSRSQEYYVKFLSELGVSSGQ